MAILAKRDETRESLLDPKDPGIGRIGTRSWEATSVQERLPRLHQRHRYVSNATDSDSSAWKKPSQQQEVYERQ